jgi:choline dehydrogenase-like flavoprotein
MNAGYPVPKDPRTGSAIGGFSQLTTVDPKHVRRSYSARNYYEPNAARPNLSVLTEALVTKIELRKEGAKDAVATGVSFTVGGTTHTVKAVKEVVVCGGSINSPQILELSGIGSPTVLQEAGVDVVVENHNVGEGLNDHAIVGICFVSIQQQNGAWPPVDILQQVRDEYPTAEILFRNPDVAQQAMQAYLEHKAGVSLLDLPSSACRRSPR